LIGHPAKLVRWIEADGIPAELKVPRLPEEDVLMPGTSVCVERSHTNDESMFSTFDPFT
jgi:hypothetical protein